MNSEQSLISNLQSPQIALAVTYHDPNGRLHQPIAHALPLWLRLFDGIAVDASDVSHPATLALLAQHSTEINVRPSTYSTTLPPLGLYRRTAVSHALALDTDYVLLCDADRAAHWANFYPDELTAVVNQLPQHDLTVIGRTPRAFASHPQAMVQTETIINRVFAQLSGHDWDVLTAARGLSRRAAEFVVAHSQDDTFGIDATWPLLLLKDGRFTHRYLATEGMEFETADAYPAEVAAAGGLANWLAQLDADPQQWVHRLEAARVEIAAMANMV